MIVVKTAFLQIYIELFSPDNQTHPVNVPDKVHLQVRHLSGSFFRDGNDEIKQYRQPLGAYRRIRFDRFAISDETKCRESKEKGSFSRKFLLFESTNGFKMDGFQIIHGKKIFHTDSCQWLGTI